MKKFMALAAAGIMIIGLAACGSNGGSAAGGQASTKTTQAAKPLNLTGTWVEKSPKSKDMVQEATITADTIVVNWKQSDGTTALYWAGSYEAPKTASTSYEWTSTGDKDKMSAALFASQDATKKFTYKDGQLSFEVTAMGTTATSKLERQ
jgi:hypothetical protein